MADAQLSQPFDFCKIIGRSPSMRVLYKMIIKVARSDSTVLIGGPSGSGKELVADAIHSLSARRRQPLVTVHCAAFPDQLLESELFGHCKGAFTGAGKDRIGRFEKAHQGTLFLDEVGEISPLIQVKLLRAIQFKTFERIGESKPIKADIRIMAATHRNLRQGVVDGWFREDLYYRLNVIPISVPPLCERKDDIPLLVNHFLSKHGRSSSKGLLTMSDEALRALMDYPFPGNVRELENLIERAVVLMEKDVITPDIFAGELLQNMPTFQHRPFSEVIDHEKLFKEMRNIIRLHHNAEAKPWHQTVRCVPFEAIGYYLIEIGHQWFTRKMFAEFLRHNAASDRSKYKTAGVYLNILTTNNICIHNGAKANQSAYRLSERYFVSRKPLE